MTPKARAKHEHLFNEPVSEASTLLANIMASAPHSRGAAGFRSSNFWEIRPHDLLTARDILTAKF
jgi:hypothetical protein